MKPLRYRAKIYVGFNGWGYAPPPDEGDFINWYADKGNEGTIAQEFRRDVGPEPRFVFAVYHQPPYSGSATIVFYRDGKWFHEHGSHCSCNGLEESGWKPEEFDPTLYLWGVEAGKRMLNLEDGEGENPEVTNAFFDRWLKSAHRATLKTSGDLATGGASSPVRATSAGDL